MYYATSYYQNSEVGLIALEELFMMETSVNGFLNYDDIDYFGHF